MADKMKQAIKKYNSLPVQVRSAFWFLFCSFMQKGISSITTPIFTRLMSTEEYGRYSVFNSWLGIITIFVSLELYSGVYMQGLVKNYEQREEYSSALQGLTLVLIGAWTGIYLLSKEFWNKLFSLSTVQMLAMIVMIWTTAVFSFWSSYQRADFKYRKLVIVTVLVSIAKPLVGIVFVILADDKVTARILGLALVELVGYTGFFFGQVRRGKKLYNGAFWKRALLFNLPLIPHYLSTTVLNSSDRIMISRMIDDDVAGIYSLAYSVSQLMTMFNTALTRTLEPWRYKKLREGKPEDISRIFYPTLTFIAVLNLLLIALAPEIVTFFAPTAYYDAIWVIPPVSMSTYFMFMYGYFAVFEFYYEKTQYTMIATTSGAVLNIVLNYFFIRLFGYYAAGYTTLVCYMVYAIAHYYFMRRICREKLGDKTVYSMKSTLAISLAFMAIGFSLLMTYNCKVLRYALVMALLLTIIAKRHVLITYVQQIINIRKERGESV